MKFFKIKFLYAAFLLLSLAFISCEKDVKADRLLSDYVGLEEMRVVELIPTESTVLETKVYATASNVDRTIELYFDENTNNKYDQSNQFDLNYVSMPTTVTIPAGATEVPLNISIENYGVGSSGKHIRIGIVKQEGINVAVSNADVNSAGSNNDQLDPNYGEYNDPWGVKLFTIVVRDFCPYVSANLSITFDNYPEETAWELYDSAFNVIASGGLDAAGTTITGYAALGYPDGSTFSTDFCLEPGDYTFVIYDDYGDGMYTSASVQGSYLLKLTDGTVLATGGGNFGTFQDTAFTIQ